MASSRWKRFAFFERHTLSLPSDVLEDIISVRRNEDEDVDDRGNSSNRRSLRTLRRAGQEASNDSIDLVLTTATLPLKSKPKEIETITTNQNAEFDALGAMWSSLTACTSPEIVTGSGTDKEQERQPLVQLPNQGQVSTEERSSDLSLVDGLVLAFVTSSDTEFVHCFDVTVRCNPPLADAEKDLEDLDGWRGYFAPFVRRTTGDRSQEAMVAEHMADSSSECVVGLASCRTAKRAVHLACISPNQLCVWEDPHLYLSCRRPLTSPRSTAEAKVFSLQHSWSLGDGECRVVDICPGIVAVGTSAGAVMVLVYNESSSTTSSKLAIRPYLRIPPPPADGVEVVSVKLSIAANEERVNIFVAYRRSADAAPMTSLAGICCYEMPLPAASSSSTLSAPSARHDLDGRYVGSSSLVDSLSLSSNGVQVTVARPDGLYSYSRTERTGVAPIDGTKLAICLIPPPIPAEKAREVNLDEVASGYALVASTDSKSGRDAVDIYDSMNKLVAFHLLLSPGHRAVRAAGVTTSPTVCEDGSVRSGRSSAVVLTSGGSLVTLTEKLTAEKISLLVQKNLYSAAIVVAYADPSYDARAITNLYRQYAEHLYRKGDFSGAMDQYMYTIGSLESSHVIFRFLDAPKIPLLVKYLEKLRSRDLATPVHNELLRTCYLKLNDTEAADAIAASSASSVNKASIEAILANLSNNPKEALATICSLDAEQAAEILVVHGASLARVLPRETAGVVVALCVGKYSPQALADAAGDAAAINKIMNEDVDDESQRAHDLYPVHLFASAFIEHPKMLRLILTHCNRHKCHLTPSLRRTLLELTLAEWNQARRHGDSETEKLRHKEAIAALTDSHSREIGDYDALVIVQSAGFEDGELLLYERLQMTPMLLERYAKDGSEKSRRQMLAMSQTEPEILADVLGHFVKIASEKLNENRRKGDKDDNGSEDDEAEEILDDIQEALALARRQGVLPPVRVARILAGEGTGQFSTQDATTSNKDEQTVPLSVALDYVGTILDESRKEISRLTSEVEEYNQICNSMENEIDSLLRASHSLPITSATTTEATSGQSSRLNIDEVYSRVRAEDADTTALEGITADQPREAFWRDMNQSEDTFDTIARFFAKGVIR